jgi:hypothetical protein
MYITLKIGHRGQESMAVAQIIDSVVSRHSSSVFQLSPIQQTSLIVVVPYPASWTECLIVIHPIHLQTAVRKHSSDIFPLIFQ